MLAPSQHRRHRAKFDTNSKNRLIEEAAERAVRNCSHQIRIRRIRFHWKGCCQNSSSICSDCIPSIVFCPLYRADNRVSKIISACSFRSRLTDLVRMEKFSGLRDYGESSITVEELTDSWFRIENYTRAFYRWIFRIIFEMNKIFEQWIMKWSVDKCFWRLLAREKRRFLSLFER